MKLHDYVIIIQENIELYNCSRGLSWSAKRLCSLNEFYENWLIWNNVERDEISWYLERKVVKKI